MIMVRGLWAALLALLTSTLAIPSAAAADESVSLDVTYAILATGDIDVRYELDWRFPSKDSHGINFEIVTREPYDDDHDAVYTVSDIRVSSPTGANTDVLQRASGSGRSSSETLRIGSPDETVGRRDHTYVIEYQLGGGLRTFDGAGELFLDVTGLGYPDIRDYQVTVKAPAGIDKARCLVGNRECDAAVDSGVAVLTGTNPHDTVTAVAGFDLASVANAEPNLEPRRITRPEPLDEHVRVTVGTDGVLHVRHEARIQTPNTDEEERLRLVHPSRRPWDLERDQEFTVGALSATVDGTAVTADRRPASRVDSSRADDGIVVEIPPGLPPPRRWSSSTPSPGPWSSTASKPPSDGRRA